MYYTMLAGGCQCARLGAAKFHTPGVSSNRSALPHGSGGQKSQTKVLEGPDLSKVGGTLCSRLFFEVLWFYDHVQPPTDCACPCAHICFQTSSFNRDISHIDQCPHY